MVCTFSLVFSLLLCDSTLLYSSLLTLKFCTTESLFRLWLIIDNDHKPLERDPALRALYKTDKEAIAYENIMKEKVFDVVCAECIVDIERGKGLEWVRVRERG
jgi:hypothetical protein